MKAIRRHLRIAPKKVNLVADLVRGKPVETAMNFLTFTPKRSAKPLLETIRSAVANAEQNFKQNRKELYVRSIIVNEGETLKRFRPVSRGRSHPLKKRTSHITVELALRAMPETTATKMAKAEKAEKTVKKSAKPAEAKKASSKKS